MWLGASARLEGTQSTSAYKNQYRSVGVNGVAISDRHKKEHCGLGHRGRERPNGRVTMRPGIRVSPTHGFLAQSVGINRLVSPWPCFAGLRARRSAGPRAHSLPSWPNRRAAFRPILLLDNSDSWARFPPPWRMAEDRGPATRQRTCRGHDGPTRISFVELRLCHSIFSLRFHHALSTRYPMVCSTAIAKTTYNTELRSTILTANAAPGTDDGSTLRHLPMRVRAWPIIIA